MTDALGRTRSLAAHQRMIANLKHGQHRTLPAIPRPTLTPARASAFVTCVMAGLPPDHALQCVDPAYYRACAKADRKAWADDWINSKEVLDATTRLHDAPWHELDPKERLELAIEKAMADLAYYVYTTNYADAFGPDLDKLHEAREALVKWVKEQELGEDSPIARAVKKVLASNAPLMPQKAKEATEPEKTADKAAERVRAIMSTPTKGVM